MERSTVSAVVNSTSSSTHHNHRNTASAGATTTVISFNPNAPISFPHKPLAYRRSSEDPITRVPVAAPDTEISIFSAERYFSGQEVRFHPKENNRYEPSEPSYLGSSSVTSANGYGREVPFPATPTASSEASWNSRSGLLRNSRGSAAAVAGRTAAASPASREQRKGSSSATKWRLGCPCSGKRSIDVEERFHEPKSPSPRNNYDLRSTSGRSTAMILHNQVKPTCVVGLSGPPNEPEILRTLEEITTTLKVVPGKWGEKDGDRFPNSTLYPSKPPPYSPVIGHRTVSPTAPYSDTSASTGGGIGTVGGPGFTFPVLAKSNQDIDPPRDSLEVFKPKDIEAPTRSMTVRTSAEFPRRWPPAPSFITEDSRRSFTFPTKPKPDDDLASDASSDLFEIESISTQMTSGNTYRRRDSLDEILESRAMGRLGGSVVENEDQPPRVSIAPSECYPPSEVSVQWSVTTAEGFDRASVANFSCAASEFEETRIPRTVPERDKSETGSGRTSSAGGSVGVVGAERRRPSGGGLLNSCRCEKAVDVGPNPVRFVPERRHHESPMAVQAIARAGFGATLNGGDTHRTSAVQLKAPARPALVRSNSARMSLQIQREWKMATTLIN